MSDASTADRLRILVHDYAGHPFTAELSRELARRGHRVDHAYFAADSGPKGRNSHHPDDPPDLRFHPISIASVYSKRNLLRRRAGDVEYGRAAARLVTRLAPDVVLSGNTPTEAQAHLQSAAAACGAAFIYWCQDFYSIAASNILRRRIPGPGHVVGAWYRHLERGQMARADHVLHITDAFRGQTDAWGIPRERVSVIPNWGVIDDIPVLPRQTRWADEQGLGSGARFVYSGTLALKHNPDHLARLAGALSAPDELITVSAGVGSDRLVRQATELPRLRCLPLQPFDRLAEVLGAADVLLGLIERDAGNFSVPSKILSYLCAGRPIVLAAPDDNLAAQIILRSGAGRVVAPEDGAGFVRAALDYAADPQAARAAGEAGRAYAEAHFVLPRIAQRFEDVFRCARDAA